MKFKTIAAAFWLFCSGAALAADDALPKQMAWTAYDTGTSGFNVAVAIGQAFQSAYGSTLRVIPAGTDIARLAPLKTGRAEASAMGSGIYFAQEGVFEFAVEDWGPQQVRLILTSTSCGALSLGVAGDTGVKEFKDLKGKRVGFLVASPGSVQNTLALLAFGGLSRDDVEAIEFSSNAALWNGVLNGQADAAFGSTVTSTVRQLEASPRGIVWPPTPASNEEGWERIRSFAPYYVPTTATCGAGISEESPIELPTYPYPIFMSYADTPDEVIKSITAAMIEQYPAYKDASSGAAGLDPEKQILQWAIPFHSGAIAALTDAGIWTEEAQAHNDAMIKRQDILSAAWDEYSASPDADDFMAGWMKARATALTENGEPVIFD